MKSLFYTGEAIKCRGCGQEFEVSQGAVQDPERMVMAMERISDRHQCKGPEAPGRQATRVYHMPSGAGLNLYYAREMQRFSA
jgi:hypothetical protein